MESSALLPRGSTRVRLCAGCPRAEPPLPMSCFPRLWHSGTARSPGSPEPPAAPASPGSSGSPASPASSSASSSASSPASSSEPWEPPASPSGSPCAPLPSPRSWPRSPLASPGSPGSPKAASPVECSICFSAYDNSFKTPKVLQCSHVFCVECVARLSAAQAAREPRPSAGPNPTVPNPTGPNPAGPNPTVPSPLPCPLCRRLTALPPQGAPGLRTHRPLLATLPPALQRERPLWMDGTRLCCRRASGDAESAGACDSIDVAMSKADGEEAAAAAGGGLAGRLWRCELCEDWKRVVLLSALLIIVFCIILWPVQCALKTGNLRCFSRPAGRPEALLQPKVTPTAAATRPPFQ